jgi:methionyl-tRNA formyltransferase
MRQSRVRLTVFAMSRKGLAVVRAIQHEYPGLIAMVVASRDTAMGDDCYDLIKDLCHTNGLSFVDRTELAGVSTEFALAVSWRWLIDHSQGKLIVLHDSLLPRYRGFNPLVTALINGDAEVGVTALYASDEFDRGDIIGRSALMVSYPTRIGDVIERIAECYVEIALLIASKLAHGEVPPAQDESQATYSLWRDDEDYFVDWNQPASRVKREVDALGFPYRGAACWIGEKIGRILEAQPMEDVVIANRCVGKVIFLVKSKPVVVCGQGLLRIEAMVDDAGRSLLPLEKFRTRLSRTKPAA